MVLEKKLVIEPYVYQLPVIQKVKETLTTRDVVLFVMAMGLGKTVVSAFVAQDWLRSGKKGLFLCHETYILDQVEQEYRKVIGNDLAYKTFYGSEKDGKKDWTADNADMLFASFQSFNNWHEKWYLAFDPDHFDFMVVDESHHGQAPSYKEVIDYFRCKKIGMTATPDRMDLKDIREIFGEEVANIPLEVGIANGWLANVEYHILSDGINNRKLRKICKEVLEKGKRVSIKQLNETIFISERDKAEREVIEEYTKIKKYAQGKKTLLFCEGTTHADNLIPYFPNSGVMHSKKTKKENDRVFNAFKDSGLQYVASVNKFNEGKHVAGVEVIVFLRATDSLTVFWQQLGRALAKIGTKTKVIVLDFVANLERLVMVRDLMLRIKQIQDELPLERPEKKPLDTNTLNVSGEGFEFIFSDELVDVMKIIEALRKGFYETWQEAGSVAVNLGVTSKEDYAKKYRNDLRLPSDPRIIYSDFPGWFIFLDKPVYYLTWQEASASAIKLGARTRDEYLELYKSDPRLHSSPEKYYADFPGALKFFNTDPYPTWQEASKAAIALGIKSFSEYLLRYKEDPKLLYTPKDKYPDFPGFEIFLDLTYQTWQEASAAAIKLKILSKREYEKRSRVDEKLPSSPRLTYSDFPGFEKFLNTDPYSTWQEASAAAIKLGIKNYTDYGLKFSKDAKLRSANQLKNVYSDYPGFEKFLGNDLYATWQEASAAAIKLKIKTLSQYFKKYKKDKKLPMNLSQCYPNFPGARVFFGGENFYATCSEASQAAIALGIKTKEEYVKRYTEDKKLHCDPRKYYKSNFPGYRKFFGKKID